MRSIPVFSDQLKFAKIASYESEEAMKKNRHSYEQIARVLRDADKDPVLEVPKRHGVSEQSIYGWRKRFFGMAVDDVKELQSLT
jgi:hypothetical protein